MNPPKYIADKVTAPDPEGPAQHLLDGKWCGHGEPLFDVYDVRVTGDAQEFRHFHVSITDETEDSFTVAAVELWPPTSSLFLIYDSRKHPACVFCDSQLEPVFTTRFECPECQHDLFRAAVGFEIPGDASCPEDTSWFALAVECASCHWHGIVFDDETA